MSVCLGRLFSLCAAALLSRASAYKQRQAFVDYPLEEREQETGPTGC